MKQVYHSNATTNLRLRNEIRNSSLPAKELADKYGVTVNTIYKWSSREEPTDKSSRPHNIKYSLSVFDMATIIAIRKST